MTQRHPLATAIAELRRNHTTGVTSPALPTLTNRLALIEGRRITAQGTHAVPADRAAVRS